MTDIPDEGQQILAVMPLHAISTVYGEQGLRARLAIETARLDDPPSRQKIGEALQLAGRLHAPDRRQREPYVNHLLRVALRIICHYGVRDPDVICAALLHDVVEDHASDLASTGDHPATLAVLAARFSQEVATLVEAVTNPVYLPGQDKDEQYRAHVAASLADNPRARVIKVSDFTDNGVGIIHTTGPKAVRLARKYAPLVPVLADLIARPDTPLTPHVKILILGQLRTAQQRFAAIAPPAAAGPSALRLQSHTRIVGRRCPSGHGHAES
jgi:HD domain-containing protein